MMLLKETSLPLLRRMASTSTFRLNHLCRRDWNPGPRRGKEDAFEKQIAGKWHIITLRATSCENIYKNSITHVEFAGAERGQFLVARGVRQGCPASGFLLAMAFDPIFRWLQEVIIPRNPDNLEFLQPAQCADADDLAVASSSFRGLMTALAPAFRSVDSIAGLHLNYRKCCWVQYGTERHDSLRTWISENCEEFRDMQIVRHAKHVGTMIGPDGHLHRWTAARKIHLARVKNQCFYPKSG